MSVEPFWPDWGVCSDPPEESCSDAGCPVHGDQEGTARLPDNEEEHCWFPEAHDA